jgi:hypothetical protein
VGAVRNHSPVLDVGLAPMLPLQEVDQGVAVSASANSAADTGAVQRL